MLQNCVYLILSKPFHATTGEILKAFSLYNLFLIFFKFPLHIPNFKTFTPSVETFLEHLQIFCCPLHLNMLTVQPN